MIPEGKIIRVFQDKRRMLMAIIRPVEGGRPLFAEDRNREYKFGEIVRYGFKRKTSRSGDFVKIKEEATGKPRDPYQRRDASKTRTILFYDPEDKMGNVEEALIARSFCCGTFRSVPEFFQVMHDCQNHVNYNPPGCVVLESLEGLPLDNYPVIWIPRRVKRDLEVIEQGKELLGGAIVADEIANEYGYQVFVNRFFNGRYEFLRSRPGIEQFPESLDDRVRVILRAMNRYKKSVYVTRDFATRDIDAGRENLDDARF